MDSAFRAFLETPDPGAKPAKRRGGYNSFGWTICLLLLTGAVMASWITSFYVFSHPENPACYHFLKKLNRIEPPKRFDLTAAPPGKFFTAKELYDSYLTMSDEDLDAKNHELLRDYLRNYTGVKTPVRYIWGRFITTGVHDLVGADMFPTGMVAVADSKDCPQVEIEYIYPTAFSNVPRARQMLAMDPEINLEKSFSLAAIVHVGKIADGRMLFTVMPIDYGAYAYKQGISSTFRLDAPSSVNLEAGLPVVKPDGMDDAVKTFALYRKNKGLLAKEKMLTLPPAPDEIAASQPADIYATDIPPEAFQPYVKPVIATPPTPAPAPAPETAVATSEAAPPPVMPPAGELSPVSAQSSVEPQAAVAQTAAESPPAASASTTSPVTAAVSPPTTAAPVASLPTVAKTSPPLPHTASVSTAQTAPALPRPAAPAKPGQIVGKPSVAALPSPAPAVRPVARFQPPPTAQPTPLSATAAAFLATRSSTSKPKVSTYANAAPAPSKPATDPAPPATAGCALPYLPPPVPVEYAEAVPTESSASGVKLNPFLATQPPPSQPPQAQQPSSPALPRAAIWQTYRPGLIPRGKLIGLYQAPQLADLGIGSECLYVDGRFIVTASSEGRAVLRPVDYNGSVSGNSVRMVVEYPSGAPIPAEGAQVSRGAYRPFQITDVRRGADGQINIYAREVTVPMSQPSSYPPGYYRMAQRGSGLD